MSVKKYLVLDYETRSLANIKICGGYEYARHDSTRILCAAWMFGTLDEIRSGKVTSRVWSPAIPSGTLPELIRHLTDPSVILVAHNAFFEQVITRYVLTRYARADSSALQNIPTARWICTAAMARVLALPGKLELACEALSLPVQKDKVGHKLMLKMSKPRKPSKKDARIWHFKKSDLLRLINYCVTDVHAEASLLTTLPMLTPMERKLWLLDQKINFHGFKVDRPLVIRILEWIEEESARFDGEVARLTRGEVRSASQRDAVLAWLASQGVHLPDLTKATVASAVASGVASGDALELLRIRAESAKISTAKYVAFEMRSRTDGRTRDNLVFSAAATKRWGGAGLQPQNFPRGTIANTDQAVAILSDPRTDLELIRMLYGSPLEVFSSCLRAMITASEGKQFIGGDFAGVELRILFWLARHEAGLDAIRRGEDLYVDQAADIYRIAINMITKKQRQVGKAVVLGAGFQMGAERFLKACLDEGIEMDLETAKVAIQSYRTKHAPVPKLWSNTQRAAHAAVLNPGKRYTINRLTWFKGGDFLFCQLPSGGRIAYYKPTIRMKLMKWGEQRACLYHWGLDSITKKWREEGSYGGKLVENCVQATARELMAESMLRVDERGVALTLTVHDELKGEQSATRPILSVKEFEKLMAQSPDWAEGLPINVEGWQGQRYRK